MAAAGRRPGPGVIGEVLRFGVIGVTATLVHFLVLTALVGGLGFYAPLANGLAFCVAVCVTFIGQSRWVFRGRDGTRDLARDWPARQRLMRFAVSVLSGLFGNMAIMALATQGLGLDYRVGFVAGLVIVPAATFVLNKFWVFGDRYGVQ